MFLPSAGATAKLSVKMPQHEDLRFRALVASLATGPDIVTDLSTSTYKDSTQFLGWVNFTVVLSPYGEAILKDGRGVPCEPAPNGVVHFRFWMENIKMYPQSLEGRLQDPPNAFLMRAALTAEATKQNLGRQSGGEIRNS